MKKMRTYFILSLFAVITLLGNKSFAQNQLKAVIDYKTFYVPDHGALVDLQFQYAGYSLKYIKDSSGVFAKIAVQSRVMDLNGVLVSEKAYLLSSPFVRDSIVEDFFDVQQFSLNPGSYIVDISLTDMNTTSPSVTGQVEINVPNREGTIAISDILIAETASRTEVQTSLTKSGYEIIPRLTNFFGSEISSLPYYVEFYNTDMFGDSVIGIHQRIVNDQNVEIQGFTKIVRLKTNPVVSYIRNINISELPTGAYRLEIAVLDKSTLLPTPTKSTYFFDRVNDIEVYVDVSKVVLDPAFQGSITDDSVFYYLASLMPIAKITETRNILSTIKLKDKDAARRHIQQFWIQTSGVKAYDSWIVYKNNVQLVEELYSNNFQDGFETDRGRVFLQYGPPNQITSRETSPTEYPYEIWQYDAIKVYHNKRFIFYNPDLVNNAYRLLHSDMLGEIQNRAWPTALTKRNTPNGNIDDPNSANGTGTYGSNSGTYYKQF